MSAIMKLNVQQRKRLHQITLVATFGGLLFGYDTGVINGAFSSLKQYMGLTPTTEGDAPRDKCGHSGAINHGHTCCYM